jgi:hypothetical protein
MKITMTTAQVTALVAEAVASPTSTIGSILGAGAFFLKLNHAGDTIEMMTGANANLVSTSLLEIDGGFSYTDYLAAFPPVSHATVIVDSIEE